MARRSSPTWGCLMLTVAFFTIGSPGSEECVAAVQQTDHVVVTYEGISEAYAKAIARTIDTARRICVDDFQFEMPRLIRIRVVVDPRGRTRLFNDGKDTFSLTVRDEKDLRKPRESGIWHLYGLCHEVAHLAMYRLVTDHSWLSSAAAEGWAHYLGSRIVDRVYQLEGEALWPDRYDYRQDGMARLLRQREAEEPSPINLAAFRWQHFVEIVGDKGVTRIFKSWGEIEYDATNPTASFTSATAKLHADKRLNEWWEQIEESFVVPRQQSKFKVTVADPTDLIGQPTELAHDDGLSEGKRSLAGGGHAVHFQVPDNSWYLTRVRIFGTRYGRAAAPKEDFRLWLCDNDLNVIKEFHFPYSKFERGFPAWVQLDVPPTSVPEKFTVCIEFNPTASKGVFVHYDGKPSGNSLTGLPGRAARPFDHDWMIRLGVDQPKSADALRDAAVPSNDTKD